MTDAMELLRCDHDEVRRLLSALEDSAFEDGPADGGLACQLVIAASGHEAIEEQYFWPLVRRRVQNGPGSPTRRSARSSKPSACSTCWKSQGQKRTCCVRSSTSSGRTSTSRKPRRGRGSGWPSASRNSATWAPNWSRLNGSRRPARTRTCRARPRCSRWPRPSPEPPTGSGTRSGAGHSSSPQAFVASGEDATPGQHSVQPVPGPAGPVTPGRPRRAASQPGCPPDSATALRRRHIYDERRPDARPPEHRRHVHPVLPRLGQQPLADLVLADRARERRPHAELGQGHGLVGALAAEQLPPLVHAG